MTYPTRVATAFALGVVGAAAPAAAHIQLTSPPPRTLDQKDRHCGQVVSSRGATATTYQAGQQITVEWDETIDHPGYFRVSFQADGSEFRIPEAGGGGFPDEDMTGMTDVGSGSVILADRIPDGTGSVVVTLPDVACDNCTLQVIQLMTDKAPYTTDGNSNDIYFQCADLVLVEGPVADAGPDADPDAGVGVDAGGGGGGDGDGDGAGGGSAAGGCAAAGGATAGGAFGLGLGLGLVGILGSRRRRRRAR